MSIVPCKQGCAGSRLREQLVVDQATCSEARKAFDRAWLRYDAARAADRKQLRALSAENEELRAALDAMSKRLDGVVSQQQALQLQQVASQQNLAAPAAHVEQPSQERVVVSTGRRSSDDRDPAARRRTKVRHVSIQANRLLQPSLSSASASELSIRADSVASEGNPAQELRAASLRLQEARLEQQLQQRQLFTAWGDLAHVVVDEAMCRADLATAEAAEFAQATEAFFVGGARIQAQEELLEAQLQAEDEAAFIEALSGAFCDIEARECAHRAELVQEHAAGATAIVAALSSLILQESAVAARRASERRARSDEVDHEASSRLSAALAAERRAHEASEEARRAHAELDARSRAVQEALADVEATKALASAEAMLLRSPEPARPHADEAVQAGHTVRVTTATESAALSYRQTDSLRRAFERMADLQSMLDELVRSSASPTSDPRRRALPGGGSAHHAESPFVCDASGGSASPPERTPERRFVRGVPVNVPQRSMAAAHSRDADGSDVVVTELYSPLRNDASAERSPHSSPQHAWHARR